MNMGCEDFKVLDCNLIIVVYTTGINRAQASATDIRLRTLAGRVVILVA